MSSLGHLNALRAFEASARLLSFSAAAEELHVTPAAVGQLVRSLEENLGTDLFIRNKSGKHRLALTEAASKALPDIQAGFDRLLQGIDKMHRDPLENVLTVAVSPAFAAKWLLPRIERFHRLCDKTDIRLDTNLKPVDFQTNGIDIGIRYGQGHWKDVTAEKWLEEEVFPVCSPSLLEHYPHLASHPSALNEPSLIHDLSMDEQSGFPSWQFWLEKAGLSGMTLTTPSVKINNSAAVLQTALEGHGVALARSVMAHDDIQSGRLIRLYPDISCLSALSYYVVYRKNMAQSKKLQTFKHWLFEETKSAKVR